MADYGHFYQEEISKCNSDFLTSRGSAWKIDANGIRFLIVDGSIIYEIFPHSIVDFEAVLFIEKKIYKKVSFRASFCPSWQNIL